MKKDIIKYLVLSDIHLGHTGNKTEEIVNNLNTFFNIYYKELKDIDILFISGDVFDRLVSTRSMEYRLIVSWLSNLLLWCKDRNVKLRILYGTPGHDNDQVAGFTDIANKLAPTCDFKYVSNIWIEKMDDLGITVLYIPDEVHPDSEDTWNDVKNLMKEEMVSEVDISIMHGCFNYQLPIKDLKFMHKESNYLDITKYYINIGHIHTSSCYERILAPGSFDRLTHGEEENKGGLLCKIYKDGNMNFKFLINKNSKIFKTLDYTGKNESYVLKDLDKELKKYPPNSFIRLLVDDDNTLIKSLKSICNKYPVLNIKIKVNNEVNESIKKITKVEMKTFEITKDNIKELMLKEMNISGKELEIFNTELEEAIS